MIDENKLFSLLERIAVALESKGGGAKAGKPKRGIKKEGGWGNPDANVLSAATIFGSTSEFHKFVAGLITAKKSLGITKISSREIGNIVRREKGLTGKSFTFFSALHKPDVMQKLGLKKRSSFVFEIL